MFRDILTVGVIAIAMPALAQLSTTTTVPANQRPPTVTNPGSPAAVNSGPGSTGTVSTAATGAGTISSNPAAAGNAGQPSRAGSIPGSTK